MLLSLMLGACVVDCPDAQLVDGRCPDGGSDTGAGDTSASETDTFDTGEELAEPWVAEGGQEDAFLGIGVAVGDVNGDGYDDVLAGASGFDGEHADEGRVYAWLGSPAGLSDEPGWEAGVGGRTSGLGARITTGDVDCDGIADTVVAAPNWDNTGTDVGRVVVYAGSPDGPAAEPVWSWEGDRAGSKLGYGLGAGDVNGDGCDDLLVGAPAFVTGEPWTGGADLFLGSGAGLADDPVWTTTSDQELSMYGVVAVAGDTDGDGLEDLLVSAENYDHGDPDEGMVWLYPGSEAGADDVARWSAEGDQAAAYFGSATSRAGDVDADGYGDVLINAYAYDDLVGDGSAVWLYRGSSSGLEAEAAWQIVGDQQWSYLGFDLAPAGDWDGDGHDDVLVGATQLDVPALDEGAAFLYLGNPTGLSSTPAWSATGDQLDQRFGRVGGAGDVDGDGSLDLLVGALHLSDGESQEGAIYLFFGGE